jgi:hypothetical protein
MCIVLPAQAITAFYIYWCSVKQFETLTRRGLTPPQPLSWGEGPEPLLVKGFNQMNYFLTGQQHFIFDI